jgi:hypothetical protein
MVKVNWIGHQVSGLVRSVRDSGTYLSAALQVQ